MKKHIKKLKSLIKQKRIQSSIKKIALLGLSMAILILLVAMNNDNVLSRVLGINRQGKPTPTPTEISPTLTPTPTLSPTPTYVPQKYIKPVYPTPTPDPDPIVTCHERPECGGGITNVKRSVCQTQICCALNGGQYATFPNSESCRKAQGSSDNTNNNYIPPAYVPPVYNPPTYNYQVPTSTYVAPTVDPQIAIERISSCKYACIGSVDSYLLSFRNQCRASNTLGGSYCQSILNSRTALITECQNNCR